MILVAATLNAQQELFEPELENFEKAHMFERIVDLRRSCAYALAHPSPGSDRRRAVEYYCAIANVEMPPEYDAAVDEAVSLEAQFCTEGGMPEGTPKDPVLNQRLQRLSLLEQRINNFVSENFKQLSALRKQGAEIDQEESAAERAAAPSMGADRSQAVPKLTQQEGAKVSDIIRKYAALKKAIEEKIEQHERMGLRHLLDTTRLDGRCGQGD